MADSVRSPTALLKEDEHGALSQQNAAAASSLTTDHDFVVLKYQLDQLRTSLEWHHQYYDKLPWRTDTDEKTMETLWNIQATLHGVECDVPQLMELARRHDFDTKMPGNGFRSLANILTRFCHMLQGWLNVLLESRDHQKAAEACLDQLYSFGLQVFRLLGVTLGQATALGQVLDDDSLFFRQQDHELFRSIQSHMQSTARRHYFGNAFAFYHSASVQSFLQGLGLCMVAYSHGQQFQNSVMSVLTSMGLSATYFFSPTKKAIRFLEATQGGNVEFTKKFWNLTETSTVRLLSGFAHPSIKVAQSLRLVVESDMLDECLPLGETQLSLTGFSADAFDGDEDGSDNSIPSGASHTGFGKAVESLADSLHRSSIAPVRHMSTTVSPIGKIGITVSEERRESVQIEEEGDDPWLMVDVTEEMSSTEAATASPAASMQSRASGCTRLDDWVFEKEAGDEPYVVKARLYSAQPFVHQPKTTDPLGEERTDGNAPARELLFHIHGGGFVAHSPRSHEIYLKRWAQQLGCPILSVDYTLSPEARYPTALQECFFAYNWALRHARRLGTTADRICVVGDSAGGNLAAALALRCVLENVRRPDALMLVYPALELEFSISPSRLMSVMDPLLPEGVLRNCLEAYTGVSASSFTTDDPLLSPCRAPADLLRLLCPVHIVAAGLDPLLDDTVEFARRLRAAGATVDLNIFRSMPHGFLMFPVASEDVQVASNYCIDKLCSILLGDVVES